MLDAKRLESPDVGTVVDHVWCQLVVLAVAGQKRDLTARDLTKRDEIRGHSIGRFDIDVLSVIEQRVESGTTDDSDFSTLFHGYLLCNAQQGCTWLLT